jgi:hypothetical protein
LGWPLWSFPKAHQIHSEWRCQGFFIVLESSRDTLQSANTLWKVAECLIQQPSQEIVEHSSSLAFRSWCLTLYWAQRKSQVVRTNTVHLLEKHLIWGPMSLLRSHGAVKSIGSAWSHSPCCSKSLPLAPNISTVAVEWQLFLVYFSVFLHVSFFAMSIEMFIINSVWNAFFGSPSIQSFSKHSFYLFTFFLLTCNPSHPVPLRAGNTEIPVSWIISGGA